MLKTTMTKIFLNVIKTNMEKTAINLMNPKLDKHTETLRKAYGGQPEQQSQQHRILCTHAIACLDVPPRLDSQQAVPLGNDRNLTEDQTRESGHSGIVLSSFSSSCSLLLLFSAATR